MKRVASAHWEGGLKDGKGTLDSTSGVLKKTPYSFAMRFEEQPGTNPEELIAAAHSGCYAMAFSAEAEKLGVKPASIDVRATVTLEPVDGKPTISSSHLDIVVRAPGLDPQRFDQLVEGVKAGCPVSRALNTKITVNARLES